MILTRKHKTKRLTFSLAIIIVSLFSWNSFAADSPREKPHSFEEKGIYFDLAPAFSIYANISKLMGFQWSGSIGKFMPTKSRFAWSIGGSFEHLIVPGGIDDIKAISHLFRLGPEFRLGASGERWFAYGSLTPAISGYFTKVTVGNESTTTGDGGFSFGMGAGALGRLNKHFYVGGAVEADFDVSVLVTPEVIYFVPIQIKAIVGAHF